MKRKRGYSRWSEEEEEALRKGVKMYGEGKWKRILTDQSLCHHFVERSNVDLKDKWRTMLCAERGRPGRLLNEEDSDPPATTQDMVVPASSGDIVSNKWTSHGHPKKPHLAPTQRIPVKMTQSPVAPVTSKTDKHLSTALSAAKRRHTGTTGERAQQQLQSELLIEVWKALNTHECASILKHPEGPRGGPDLAAIRRGLTISGSSPVTPCQFYTSIMELVERSRFANRDDSATMESLDSFQAFARRQFEVLSLVDEACHTSLLAVVAPATPMVSTESSPPPVDDNGKASKVTPHRGLGCCKNSREKPPPDNLRELLAADALNMIRDGSSSVGTSQVEADSKQAEGDEPEATSSPAAQQPQPVGHPSPTPPLVFSIPVPKLESCPAISVPEGCGLDSTSVSAALDKATMLLQTNDVNSLLPVKDLGLSAHASKPPTVPLASTTVPATRPVDVHTLPATSLAMPFTLVPTSGVAPLQQVFLPVSKVGSVISGALDASNLPMKLSAIPISIGPPFLPCKATPSIAKPYIPAGTESWYPAYMAWVYSGMVSSGIQ